jgi:putative PIN family toxin of toxin-antitoxin system
VRIVFDTNIYVSAFAFPGGRAEEAFFRALKGQITLCASTAILAELARILQEKFSWEPEPIAEILKYIGLVARVEKIPHRLSLLADAPDNRILECAEEAEAAFIVTGDRHLLEFKKYGTCSNSPELVRVPNFGTRIVTLAEFLR